MKKAIDSILTLGKVMVKSRRTKGGHPASHGERLIIMGNGPSLADTVKENMPLLQSSDTMAVNFAANTEYFREIKPRHYVLADPHFFTSGDSNVDRLTENLLLTDWEMTLHIPRSARNSRLAREMEAKGIEIRCFNMTPAEGYDFVCQPLYRNGLAMPRPRNVMIPALMEGIREGYGEILITGADHTWPHTLFVDDSNRVVTVQPHFYKEDPKELDRIAEAYKGIRIHQVLESMSVAFRSYHQIEKYAASRGVRIYNCTPGSLIDAFERAELALIGRKG